MSLTQQELHEKILYPVTRVRAGNAGGSGVLIYSQPDPKHEGNYINIALTCQHVIDGNIKLKDEWDEIFKDSVYSMRVYGRFIKQDIVPILQTIENGPDAQNLFVINITPNFEKIADWDS